jgi:3-oxoacyl-[acyl-carrier-protein] synthase III
MGIEIIGCGRALPGHELLSDEIDRRLRYPKGQTERTTGVRARFVAKTESQITLAVQAAGAALTEAGLGPDDIDLVIGGSAVPYQPLPATAPLVMRELGIADGRAAAYDVNSTCLSFLTALDTANLMITAGRAKTALVFSSEIASRALPWVDDPETASLFGDGAAAMVVRAAPTSMLKASLLKTYPSAWEACSIGAGGTRYDFRGQAADFVENSVFRMDGKALFRLTLRHFNAFIDEVLERAGWKAADVDLVVPHQASPFGLMHLARQTGFDGDRLVNIAADHGNQIAASLPFAFDFARKAGRIRAGTRVLMLGTAAGVSIGGLALQT